MFWLGILIVAGIALLPALYGLRRLRRRVDARDSALTLYRGQLAELDRDRDLGLVSGDEYGAARIEIQRRLLAADESSAAPDLNDGTSRSKRFVPLLAVGVGIPLAAFCLYIVNGHPSLPPQPLSARQVKPDTKAMAMIQKLQAQVTTIPKDSPTYETGHVLLGQIEARAGLTSEAIADWKAALETHFTPELAIQLAELQTQKDGHISANSLDLYRRALAAAPADAQWRMAVEARIAVGEHEENAGQ
ncbi:cytochrome c-type biogenesis protein CcmH/CycH [Gluconobacter thailandicus F149-1 = NBRC 100600]|uniref:Cytochrome c-type biogenesis protein CycH n=1 Tax=Gluconobacter thailandicus NBRC 3257 TaxID=1381097 RepID=A0ABQ0IXM8_GLUTH|nr:c-type cytochrome biogenesis protein CcmI [Gluconobacter thailandicus]KXV51830.1 cytochrome C biogenesis protein CycH [Gluconobacter thailandicus]GAC87432.1 cytochrome c-type biogenesis protein CycH [Gluconobacter thailandicus NBRC 3255]GAD26966.1 cytochrome c-type biogenesis protein CycH [Gluconobacter thailandicus NBRC 3257]GAN93484.1 cytochrome c-type biogenesis protein CcmH/CycH [Gluconobacter thailandicus F149-1 = NBRC 100600]GBR57825.1 cytochrome c-type biogenesis protein CycH [Glucon